LFCAAECHYPRPDAASCAQYAPKAFLVNVAVAALVRSDSLLGPNRLIVTVAEQLSTVQEMLPLARAGLRTRMFEIAALFAEFQGWLQDDIGSMVTGSAWTSQALDWAEVSGDDSLTAYMLMRRAQQAAARGDAALTVGLAAAARQRQGASSWVRAGAAQQEGHGHALDGDDVSALRAFDEALKLVTNAKDPVGEYELASWCTPDYVHAQRGAALIQLRQYGSAVNAFDEALSAWPREYRRERGLHLARKAYALASGRRTDEALDVGTGALRIGLETGSRRTIDELLRTARTLHSFGPAKEFDQFSDAVQFAAREGQAS
jgi:tetratricopeptide (TPR) repeat protein